MDFTPLFCSKFTIYFMRHFGRVCISTFCDQFQLSVYLKFDFENQLDSWSHKQTRLEIVQHRVFLSAFFLRFTALNINNVTVAKDRGNWEQEKLYNMAEEAVPVNVFYFDTISTALEKWNGTFRIDCVWNMPFRLWWYSNAAKNYQCECKHENAKRKFGTGAVVEDYIRGKANPLNPLGMKKVS